MNKNLRILLLAFVIFIIARLSTELLIEFVFKENVEEPACRVVEGHLYRGDCLPEDYVPEDLVYLSKRASWLNTTPRLTLKAKIMVEQLIEEAEKSGMCLVVTSGYRSYETQQELYDNTPEEMRDFVAKAGSSEHQTGLAVDFAACPLADGKRNDNIEREELANDFEELPEYGWLKENAWRYGFVESYTIDNIHLTGYPPEPWHWFLAE
jgi:zinc D-Ala-D-Ala carboxypeptidase